jgi:hypothetical protein
MSNTPGTPNNQPIIDVTAKPSMTELLHQTAPRGFGAASSEQRYQEIFEDDSQTAPGYGGRAGGLGTSYQPPFEGAYSNAKPYEDTVLFFHHNKRGVRFSVQANTKTFIVLMVIFIALTNSPGIGELINNLLKTVLNTR